MGHVAKKLRRYIACVHCGAFINITRQEYHEFVCNRRLEIKHSSSVVKVPGPKPRAADPRRDNPPPERFKSLGKTFIVKPARPKPKAAPPPRTCLVLTYDANVTLFLEDAIRLMELGALQRLKFPDWFKLNERCSNQLYNKFELCAEAVRKAGYAS